MWGPLLQKRLEILAVSQREFAQRLGVREQWLSHICNGLKPSPRLRMRIMEELHQIEKEKGMLVSED